MSVEMYILLIIIENQKNKPQYYSKQVVVNTSFYNYLSVLSIVVKYFNIA